MTTDRTDVLAWLLDHDAMEFELGEPWPMVAVGDCCGCRGGENLPDGIASTLKAMISGNNETRPGTKRAPSGTHATISLADHTFAPDYPQSFQNGPLALQDALNTHRADRDSGQFVEVRQSDLWRTLDRLARAEQSVADKIERFHEKEPEAWAGSDAYRDLKDAIVASQIGALEHCQDSSEAAGLPWTMGGLQSIAAASIIRDLIALGWLPPNPDIPYSANIV